MKTPTSKSLRFIPAALCLLAALMANSVKADVPTITTDTTNQTVCAGSQVTWWVAATGTDLTYQWQRDGTNLVEGVDNFTGVTTPALINSAAGPADSVGTDHGYACIVSSGPDSTSSTVVSLTVNPPPTISSVTPQAVTCNGGSDGSITISATGSPELSYSIDNGANYQPSGTFTGLSAGDSYNVVVMDGNDCTASYSGNPVSITQPAVVTVTENTGLHLNVTCNGCSDGQIVLNTATGGSGSGYTYSSDGGSTWQAGTTFSGLAANTYQMKARDGNLCLSANLPVAITSPATNYWDINGGLAGAGGATPNGDWENAAGYWTTDPNGSIATGSWVEGSVAYFAAGTDAIGNYTVTSASPHTIAGMLQSGAGTVTNAGATLTIADGTQIFGGHLAVSNVLAGSGSAVLQSSASSLYLYAANTFGGGVNLNGGSIYIYNNSALGAGAISPIASGFSALWLMGSSPITLANNFTIGTANAGINFVTTASTPLTNSGNVDLQQTFYCRNAGPLAGAVTFSGGVMSGAAGLVLSGNGGGNDSTTVLNGANTYTGPTVIGQGGAARMTVNINSIQPLGGSANSLGRPGNPTDGRIDIGHSGFADGLRYTGSGDTTDRIINNANTAGGMWLFADGSGALILSGNITAATGGTAARTLTIEGGSTALNTISGAIQDSTGGANNQIAVTKDGTGTWVLSGNNTYSGATTVNASAGPLKLGANNALPYGTGKGTLTVNSGTTFDLNGYNCTINNFGASAGSIDCSTGTGTLTVGVLGSVNATTLPTGVIKNSGSGTLNLTLAQTADAGNVNVSANNTYTGSTTVQTGVLQINGDGASPDAASNLGNVPHNFVANNIILDHNNHLGVGNGTYGSPGPRGYLRANANLTLHANRGIYLGNTGGYVGAGGCIQAKNATTIQVNGVISGPGALWIGPGAAVAGGQVNLNAVATYTGGTYLGSGGLGTMQDNVIPTGSPVTMGASTAGVNGTILDLMGHSQTIGPLACNTGFGKTDASTSLAVRFSGSGTLTIIQTNTTTFLNGAIKQNSGSGGNLVLHATSTGTLTLGMANDYSGSTTINGGTLALSGAGAIASSPIITIGAGGAFDVSGRTTALTLGSQTLRAGGTSGASATIATASGKGLTLGATSPLQFTAVDGSTAPLTITGAGSLAIASGNPITVTTTTALGTGSYTLVQIGSGNSTAVTGAPGALTVNGSGVNGTASLRIAGGVLYLDVSAVAPIINSSIYDPATGHLTISGQNTGGITQRSRLVYTDDLSAMPLVWLLFSPDMTSTGTTFSFTITDVTAPAQRFYKVENY